MHAHDLSTAVRECVSCHRCYDATSQFCPDCLVELVGIELIPRLINGRYRLERVLGHGSLGTVFAATDIEAKREVAVKVIRASAIADPRAQDRFRREAQLATSLDDPHLAAVYDCGLLSDASAYTVMELVRDTTLRQELKRTGKFTPARAVALLAAVADALHLAHKSGLVHRGLKPEKIALISGSDSNQVQVKLFDFGFGMIASGPSLAQSAATSQESRKGKPNKVGPSKGRGESAVTYLSPEQVRGEEADLRADIYSLGVIAYEMLAGRPPFIASNASELGRQHLNEKPRSLRLLNTEVNALLEAAIMKALEKELLQRQQRATEFKNDLLAAIQLG